MEEITQNLTLALVHATSCLETFLPRLEAGVARLMSGDDNFAMGEHPDELAALALDGYGGIFCLPLQVMKYADPKMEDLPFLQRLLSGFERLVALARQIAERLGFKATFLKRFDFRQSRVFSLDFLSACKRANVRADPERAHTFRLRAMEAICGTVRRFWAWMRAMCRRLRQEAFDDNAPIVLSPHVRETVAMVDRAGEFVVLRNPAGPGAITIRVRKECTMVWRIIRQLVERCDATGAAVLKREYGTHFRLDEKSLNEGLPILYRHIHPVKGRPDHYWLCWAEKPKLVR